MKNPLTILLFVLMALTGCDEIKRNIQPTFEVGDILKTPSRFEGIFKCHGIVASSTNLFGFGKSFVLEDAHHNSIKVKTYREVLPQTGEELTIRCKLDEVFSFGDTKILALDEIRE